MAMFFVSVDDYDSNWKTVIIFGCVGKACWLHLGLFMEIADIAMISPGRRQTSWERSYTKLVYPGDLSLVTMHLKLAMWSNLVPRPHPLVKKMVWWTKLNERRNFIAVREVYIMINNLELISPYPIFGGIGPRNSTWFTKPFLTRKHTWAGHMTAHDQWEQDFLPRICGEQPYH